LTGNEVEQSRCRNEIGRSVQREFEITRNVDGAQHQIVLRGHAREKAEIVVDKPPALAGRQNCGKRAH
jgi:hypothetical protein